MKTCSFYSQVYPSTKLLVWAETDPSQYKVRFYKNVFFNIIFLYLGLKVGTQIMFTAKIEVVKCPKVSNLEFYYFHHDQHFFSSVHTTSS